jgi:hypothetical protein
MIPVKFISHIALSIIHINAAHVLQNDCVPSILIFISHLHLAFQCSLFLLRFPTKTSHTPDLTSTPVTFPAHITLPTEVRGVKIMKLLTAQYPPVPCYIDPDRHRYLPHRLIFVSSYPPFFPKCESFIQYELPNTSQL